MLDSDWFPKILLRCDWSGPIVASMTTIDCKMKPAVSTKNCLKLFKMIIVKEKKMKKAFVCIRSKKSSYEHTRCSLDNSALERFNPEKGTGFPQKRGGLSTI